MPSNVITSDKKLKKIINGSNVSPTDVEYLGSLILKGDLRGDVAERILYGKQVIIDPLPLKTRPKFRIVEEDNVVRIEKPDGEKIGDFMYSSFNTDVKPVMFIHEIFVGEGYRGKGYGSHLIEYAEKIAKRNRIPEIMLEVDRDNPRAIDFFTKRGYCDVGATNTGNLDRITLIKDIR